MAIINCWDLHIKSGEFLKIRIFGLKLLFETFQNPKPDIKKNPVNRFGLKCPE
ncbi:MAG: hypothetical protein BAJALOKI2v1_20024 [Promethearchaeota archaeon]|nr:MAG: hypothetical protein BAJALOKI2v1_20024 [Candidatus Lokiarchaeota archaeon]